MRLQKGPMLMAVIGAISMTNRVSAQEAGNPVDSLLESEYRAVAVSPIFSQLVAHRLPGEFRPAFENGTTSSYIREAILKDETLENWSQMITVTGINGASAPEQASSLALVQSIAASFQRSCPSTFAAKALGKVAIGAYEGIVALVGCGNITSGTPRSEVAFVVSVKGSADFYTVQWAERGGPKESAPALDEERWRGRFQQLLPIRICDRIPDEPAPYPSCVERP